MKHNNWTKMDLFLSYVSLLSRKIKNEYPRLTLVIWDDMLRTCQPQEIISNAFDYIKSQSVYIGFFFLTCKPIYLCRIRFRAVS